MIDLLPLLKRVKCSGNGKGKGCTALCPAHPDKQNSLSVARSDDGKWLLCCHVGCTADAIVAALGLKLSDLFEDRLGRGEGVFQSLRQQRNCATVLHRTQAGSLCQGQGLPVDFLTGIGLSDMSYESRPAVRIPYYGSTGEQLAVRFRIALAGDRFRWKTGTKPCLYGLNRIEEAKAAGQAIVIEGSRIATLCGFTAIRRSAFQVPRIGAKIAINLMASPISMW